METEKTIISSQPDDARINPVIVFLVCAVMLVCGSFGRDLWTPDEPRVAAISLKMSRTGQYMIPYLAKRPFVEKPPLYFAAGGGSLKFFGSYIGRVNALRMVSVFFGAGTLLMTFLLARRLYGHDTHAGLLAAAILATMTGFIQNFHWIRVDPALCFFVIAAVWSFSEVYLAGKAWHCLPAGLFCAGAFLSKGPIGPVLIGIPWLILFIFRFVLRSGGLNPHPHARKWKWIGHHAAGFLIFLGLSGAWILYLKLKASPDLWNHWFWDNQVGRLTGTSVELGHIRANRPFYYVKQMFMDTFPWFPLILVWIGTVGRELLKRKAIPRHFLFLVLWAGGSLLLLSLSVTKRGIYMAPFLPAFALMCVPVIDSLRQNRWVRGYGYFWVAACACLLALFVTVPLVVPYLPQRIPAPILAILDSFGWSNMAAGACFLWCVYVFFQFAKQKNTVYSLVLATLFLYIGFCAVPLAAIDAAKSMRSDIVEFAKRIPAEKRPSIAGYHFTETMMGNFYFYGNWAVPQIEDANRVNRIITGADMEYGSLIINIDAPDAMEFMTDLAQAPFQILDVQLTGTRDLRAIYWIKGAGNASRNRLR